MRILAIPALPNVNASASWARSQPSISAAFIRQSSCATGCPRRSFLCRFTVTRHKKDRLGQPVAQLDWRINAADIDGWLRAQEALALTFGRAGIARMRIDYEPSKGMKALKIESS